MSDALPQGWELVPLKDFTKVEWGNTSITKKSYVPMGFAAFSASGQDGFLENYDWEGPAVILSAIGARCGKCFQADGKWTAIKNTIVIQGDPAVIDHKLLFHFLNDEKKWVISGTGQPFITMGTANEIRFPFAPLAEQRRIVAKLETLLGKVDASQQRLAKIPVLLKRFRQSVLAAACSGRLTADWREDAAPQDLIPPESANSDAISEVEETVEAPEAWRWLPLQMLCDPDRSICYGVIKLGVEVPNGIPCLRTSDVKPLLIDTTGVKTISPAISEEYQRTLLRGGEVLVNVRGTLGGVAVVPDSLRGWNISREVALVPVKGVVPQFIAFWIASLRCQNWLNGVAKGVAYTGINIVDLKLLPVALPSLAEQQEIVRRVEGLFALADQLGERLAKARGQVDQLMPSLLARAFAGQLVPQDPTDEPAEKLLERIRKEEPRIARIARMKKESDSP